MHVVCSWCFSGVISWQGIWIILTFCVKIIKWYCFAPEGSWWSLKNNNNILRSRLKYEIQVLSQCIFEVLSIKEKIPLYFYYSLLSWFYIYYIPRFSKAIIKKSFLFLHVISTYFSMMIMWVGFFRKEKVKTLNICANWKPVYVRT